jgi:hypothetical protein
MKIGEKYISLSKYVVVIAPKNIGGLLFVLIYSFLVAHISTQIHLYIL